jgi:hypothetical protein
MNMGIRAANRVKFSLLVSGVFLLLCGQKLAYSADASKISRADSLNQSGSPNLRFFIGLSGGYQHLIGLRGELHLIKSQDLRPAVLIYGDTGFAADGAYYIDGELQTRLGRLPVYLGVGYSHDWLSIISHKSLILSLSERTSYKKTPALCTSLGILITSKATGTKAIRVIPLIRLSLMRTN